MTYYNSKGQQIKQVTPGGMILLAQYDDLGRLAKSAIDMNRNSVIDAGDIFADFQYAALCRNRILCLTGKMTDRLNADFKFWCLKIVSES